MKRDYTDNTDEIAQRLVGEGKLYFPTLEERITARQQYFAANQPVPLPTPKYHDGQQVYMQGKPFFVTGVLSTRSDDGEFRYCLQGKKGDRGSILRGIYKESSLSLTPQE